MKDFQKLSHHLIFVKFACFTIFKLHHPIVFISVSLDIKKKIISAIGFY